MEGVEEGLRMATCIPDTTRRMILAGLNQSLGVHSDKRHECQKMLVNTVEEIFENVKEKLTELAKREADNVAEIENSQAELDNRLLAATSAKEAASEVVKREEENLQQAANAAVTAKENLRAQQKANTTAQADLKNATDRAAIFSKALETDFKALTEGDGEHGKVHHKALEPVLKDLGLEDSLQLALPSACGKRIVERTSFDTMVLQQLGVQLQEQVALTQQALLTTQAKVQELDRAVEAAKADIERTAQGQHGVADDLAKARAHQREAAAEEVSAQEAKDTFDQRLGAAKTVQEAQDMALSNFTIYNCGCFENLRDMTSPAEKAVEEPATETGESIAVGGA